MAAPLEAQSQPLAPPVPDTWSPHHGIQALWAGIRLVLARPAWWGWLAVPVALNLTVGLLALAGGWWLLGAIPASLAALVAALLPLSMGAWVVPLLGGLLGLLLGLALLVAVGWSLARFGVVLGSPFYGQLAEAVAAEVAPGSVKDTPFSWGGALRDVGRTLKTESAKLALGLAIWLLGLLLGLIPLVGPIISLALGFAVAGSFACFDAFDAPLSRKGLGFWAKLGWIWAPKRVWAHAAFAAGALPLMVLPVVNLLGMPLAMASGAAWAARRLDEAD